jgi:outer membrane protein OmpA-like peptidoglycan-associated protein
MRRVPLLFAACLLAGLSGCSVFQGGALGRKYVVFFDARSASLDRPARQVVSDAADAAADTPALDVLVEGYAAAHGNLSADEQLSAQRADVVASALRADGVAANRVRVRPRAPSNEEPGVGARRVEIDFSR